MAPSAAIAGRPNANKRLRQVEYGVALSDLPPAVKNLRTHLLKRDREIRDACLFCVGMSALIGQKIWVYPVEDADFDFVAAWEEALSSYATKAGFLFLQPLKNPTKC